MSLEFVARNGVIALNNSQVTGSLSVSSGIIGDLTGTASYATTGSYSVSSSQAVSASYALTASYALNGGTSGGSSTITVSSQGVTQGTASYFDFSGAGVSLSLLASTASINIPGGGTSGLTTTFTQSVAAATWTFTHNLNTRTPLVQVYDSSYNQIVPQYVSSSNAQTVLIGLGVATAGYAVASTGGTINVTGSNVILNQSVAAVTWSFVHNLNTQYPVFTIYNSSSEVIIPQRIVATDLTSSLIYFPTAISGYAVASVGGYSGTASIATSSSYAVSASIALTSSYSLSGTGFPYSGSAVITGSFMVSQSYVDFSKASYVSGAFTGSLLGTASYATFALSASNAPGTTIGFTQATAVPTWSFTHNLNTRNPLVQVYDSTYSQIIPNAIVGTSTNVVEIRFDYSQSGYAVASNGGGLIVTGSMSQLSQSSAAVTWSFAHNLNSKYVNFEVYDSNNYVVIPSGIQVLTTNTAEIYFAAPSTGIAVANFSGINGAPNATSASYALTATSASYALTATSASYALTASYLNPVTSGYLTLTQVSQSLNYSDDTAAAAGGVPLGGLYRNGNFILIRIS